jgi:alpha-1,6-mannosyltransferase
VEVSDRTTLRWVGSWARKRDVPSMMVSHESLDGLLRLFGPAWGRRVADRMNGRTADDYDRVVCTTRWAAAEFERIGAANVSRVPLGVDLERFSPELHDPVSRARWAKPDELLLLHCGRLSAEKKPRRSLETVAALRRAGVPAVLVVAGSGPLLPMMRAEVEKRGLPVSFLGFLDDPALLGVLLATADVVIAPGPVETFGLAALEALASGTPVVASSESALSEVIGSAGIAAPGDGPAYAEAVLDLMERPAEARRRAAREQAERFPWAAAVDGFLSAHDAASEYVSSVLGNRPA